MIDDDDDLGDLWWIVGGVALTLLVAAWAWFVLAPR